MPPNEIDESAQLRSTLYGEQDTEAGMAFRPRPTQSFASGRKVVCMLLSQVRFWRGS